MAVRTNILLKLSNFVDSLITFAKLQNIATNKILGRTTAGSGVIEELDIANYSNQLIPLTTTFANCENTAAEIDVVTVTVPANTLAVGDIISLVIFNNRLQNRGSAVNLTQRLKNGGNTMPNANITSSILNDSFNYYHRMEIIFTVISISSNIVTLNYLNTSSIVTLINSSATVGFGATNNAGNSNYSNNTFNNTVGTTISISLQWATANVNSWVRVQQAQAYIIKKAV